MAGRLFGRAKDEVTPRVHAAGGSGYGAPLHYSFGYRELPGAGAMQYAFETLCLPTYPTIGYGPSVQRGWDYTQGVVFALQGVTLEAIGSPGVKTGGIYSQPLTDTQPSELSPATQAALMMANRGFALPG